MDAFKKVIIIDGRKFSNKTGFHDYIEQLFSIDLNFKTGHNLDAFHDLLQGGFGIFEVHSPIIIKWIYFKESKEVLGSIYCEKLIAIIKEQKHIHFVYSDFA